MQHKTQATTLLKLVDVSLKLSNKDILVNINLDIERHKIITVVGPNGAGKSSLLKIVLGLLKPSCGKIYKQPNVQLGYMPQSLPRSQLLPLTVKRFLLLSFKVEAEWFLQIVEKLTLDKLLNQQLYSLSGGEMQKVLLARAMLGKPDLLVLDEPAQGVDLNGQLKLYKYIANMRQYFPCSLLMVSHDLHLVMAGTDKVICLNKHICCQGEPAWVANTPEFSALFKVKLQDYLAFYSHEHNHEHT